MKNKSRILVVASRLPFPLNGGDRTRNFHLHRSLSAFHDIDLVCPNSDRLNSEAKERLARVFRKVVSIPIPRWRYGLNAARGLFSRKPIQVCLYDFRGIREWLGRHRREYDLAIFQHIRTVPYAENFGSKKTLDLVDAISLNYTRALEYPIGLWKPVYRIELPRLKEFEVSCLTDFQRSFIVSEIDRSFLGSLGADVSRINVIPVAVPDELLFAAATPSPEENWIVFLGRLATAPNADAAEYFSRMVYPLVRMNCEAKLLILGSDPPSRIRKLGELPGVEVRGNLEDPFQYLRKARIVIAPIRFGAGMQTKVLESMSQGKPVVATSLAVAGIDGVTGQHFLVADEPEEMAAAILRLWHDRGLRRQLGEQARDLVSRRYSYSVVGTQYRDRIESTL